MVYSYKHTHTHTHTHTHAHTLTYVCVCVHSVSGRERMSLVSKAAKSAKKIIDVLIGLKTSSDGS